MAAKTEMRGGPTGRGPVRYPSVEPVEVIHVVGVVVGHHGCWSERESGLRRECGASRDVGDPRFQERCDVSALGNRDKRRLIHES